MGELDTTFCVAESKHVAEIVGLLADDELGAGRESKGDKLHANYLTAFNAIQADPNNELIVAVKSDSVIGTLQITYSPNMTHIGALRATIEGVRVSSSVRASGVGTRMIKWAVDRCRSRDCRLVQLTSDLSRADAIAFYTNLGFAHTHAGMKLWL